MTDTWAGISPAAITGFGGAEAGRRLRRRHPGRRVRGRHTGAANPPLYSPENPLFWFGVLLAAAGGLFFVSTHVKVGPAKGSVSI